MAEFYCNPTLDGIGTGVCLDGPILSMVRGFIPIFNNYTFDTLTDLKTEATVRGKIADGTIKPFKLFENIENASTEVLTSDTDAGTRIFHRNGKYGFIASMLLTPDQVRIIDTYDNNVRSGLLIDDEGNLMGQTPDGTKVGGFTVDYFKTYPMELPFAPDGSAWKKIEVRFTYESEFNKSAQYVKADSLTWDPKKVFQPMTKITLTPSTVAAFAFTCAFAYVDPTTGTSVPLRSLESDGSDLTVLNQTGAAETVTVAETSTPGTYTITGTTITSGSITLNASANSFKYSATTTLTAAS